VTVLSHFGGIFDYPAKSERLEEVTRELESPNVWDDPTRAQELGRERARLHTIVHGIDTLTAGSSSLTAMTRRHGR
jgi:peptide chain release factor 2